jgi:predicted nucleic acid binding AN1-type Zn finger protein
MLTFFRSIFIAVVTLIVFACSSSPEVKKESVSEESQEVEQKGSEYTSAYICPMHCEGSGSADPGKCPVCGMDYVANDKK